MANANDEKRPVSREVVFDFLNKERDYQTKRWGIRQADGTFTEDNHGVCDYLAYMKVYLDDAFQKATKALGDEAALAEMLKVVSLGIACFEQIGVVPRDHTKPVINMRDGKVA